MDLKEVGFSCLTLTLRPKSESLAARPLSCSAGNRNTVKVSEKKNRIWVFWWFVSNCSKIDGPGKLVYAADTE